MKRPQRATVLKYAISGGVCLALGGIYMSVQTSELGEFPSLDTATQMRLLCDAFTVPGMLLILSGLLMTVAQEGALDGLSYMGHCIVHIFLPSGRNTLKRYGDYVADKQEKRGKGKVSYRFLYIVGGICMAIALVFFGLFYYFDAL